LAWKGGKEDRAVTRKGFFNEEEKVPREKNWNREKATRKGDGKKCYQMLG